MQKLILPFLYLSILLVTGCSWFHPYQPNVQQGNLISQSMVESIKSGMSKQQVENTLGEPVLSNIFNDNHWAYVYTFQHNGGVIVRKNVDVYFQNGRVSRVISSEGKVS